MIGNMIGIRGDGTGGRGRVLQAIVTDPQKILEISNVVDSACENLYARKMTLFMRSLCNVAGETVEAVSDPLSSASLLVIGQLTISGQAHIFHFAFSTFGSVGLFFPPHGMYCTFIEV
jgi:hypothetical protein